MSQQPTPSSVSPLRRRMLEDMAMRGLREETPRDYIRFVRSFAAFLGRPPETAMVMRDFALIGEVANDRKLDRVSRTIMELTHGG